MVPSSAIPPKGRWIGVSKPAEQGPATERNCPASFLDDCGVRAHTMSSLLSVDMLVCKECGARNLLGR